jgi:hypothetical protein
MVRCSQHLSTLVCYPPCTHHQILAAPHLQNREQGTGLTNMPTLLQLTATGRQAGTREPGMSEGQLAWLPRTWTRIEVQVSESSNCSMQLCQVPFANKPWTPQFEVLQPCSYSTFCGRARARTKDPGSSAAVSLILHELGPSAKTRQLGPFAEFNNLQESVLCHSHPARSCSSCQGAFPSSTMCVLVQAIKLVAG